MEIILCLIFIPHWLAASGGEVTVIKNKSNWAELKSLSKLSTFYLLGKAWIHLFSPALGRTDWALLPYKDNRSSRIEKQNKTKNKNKKKARNSEIKTGGILKNLWHTGALFFYYQFIQKAWLILQNLWRRKKIIWEGYLLNFGSVKSHQRVWWKDILLLFLASFFYTGVSWWFFTGGWETTSLFKSPGLFSVFWLILVMLEFGWSRHVFRFLTLSVPLPSFWGPFRAHQL